MFDYIIVLSACSDVDKFQEGISNKIGNFFQSMSTFILGFIIGFVYGWKLCLVILAVSPLLVGSGIFMTHVSIPATSWRRRQSPNWKNPGSKPLAAFSLRGQFC